jgi:signal transduction histidine kinase
MVTSLRNAVVAVTTDGRLAVMNDEAYRALGIKPQPSDVGNAYDDVLRTRPDVIRLLHDAFELSTLPNRAEMRIKSTGKVIGYTLCQIADDRGRISGAALLFKDLTRVEQIEERERLRDRLAALGEMAAAIAHEVKNPLAGIEVLAGLLKRRIPDVPDAQGLLNDIIHEAKMANSIVIEVLEFVRPIRLQRESVSLPRAINEALYMAESLVTRGEVVVSTRLPNSLPEIDGDAQQLRQLFTNLITNAFEALGGTGSIAITAAHRPGEPDPVAGDGTPVGLGAIEIEITDDGPGVPREIRDRIFSPFFTTKPRGSGLGLAIVRKIVDAHDGRIDLRVGTQGGTQFRIHLPVEAFGEETGSPEAA